MLGSQFLKLCHDAVRDVGDALGIESVHHILDDVHLVLDGEIDEVGVDEYVEGGPELGVVLEEEGAGLLHVLRGLDLVGILQGGRLEVEFREQDRYLLPSWPF